MGMNIKDYLNRSKPKKVEFTPPNKKLEICRSCDKFIHATQMCKSCGCFMPLKVITPLPCPEKKWIY
tara:strand:+ start:210 stop:410 length:201 start_codon:yes stop_codon:yes gene_type:complete